jgi:hypothetical protein
MFALTSTDKTTYLQGIRGLFFWLRTQVDNDTRPIGMVLPPPPPELLRQFGANLAGRRQPGLLTTLDGANTLISEIPEAADYVFLASVHLGLQGLLTEAQYRAGGPTTSPIPEADVPNYRLLIARLARRLKNVPGGESPVVQQWLDSAATDPLPEVRHEVATTSEKVESFLA